MTIKDKYLFIVNDPSEMPKTPKLIVDRADVAAKMM
jgi:hypothetical protein